MNGFHLLDFYNGTCRKIGKISTQSSLLLQAGGAIAAIIEPFHKGHFKF
jgi:hypothetical protein